jgi:hypothetical protein
MRRIGRKRMRQRRGRMGVLYPFETTMMKDILVISRITFLDGGILSTELDPKTDIFKANIYEEISPDAWADMIVAVG